ncbi:MAG: hypothetical protein KQH83_09690 [Actinobacteria bacterium]|nr:hypothetical protein [Actinomycetota bacterium]
MKRRMLAAGLAAVVVSCGGTMSLTEYVDEVNEIVEEASERGAEIIAAGTDVDEFTPQVLQAGLEAGTELRTTLQEKADALDPPDQVAGLHELMWGWHRDFIEVERALAVRAGATPDTEEGWTALSASPEMAAYRDALAEGTQVCAEFQQRLDATEARGAFAETPWIPPELKEVVEAVLGCSWFPEHPEDVYRYPPPEA